MFATLGLHLRRLTSRRLIRLERIDSERIRKTLEFYVRSIPALLDAERCNIFVYDPNARMAWLEVGTGAAEGEFEIPVKSTLIGEVIASGRTQIANDLAHRKGAHIEVDGEAGFVSRDAIYAPVRSRYHEEVIGVVEAINKKSAGGFTTADAALIEDAAEGIQDLVDSVFLDQSVYGTADEFLAASRLTLAASTGLILIGVVLALLVVAASSVMPVINEAVSPTLKPFLPSELR